MYFSCSNGGCNWAKFDCSPLYNVLRSVGAHPRNNLTRALNYAHPYGYKSANSFHSPQGHPIGGPVASVAKSWEL